MPTFRPNVLLIIADCLRPDIPILGHDSQTTPFLEARLRQARVFSQCRTVTGWTLPACASILTGQPPEVHGLWDHAGRFRVPKVTQRLDGYVSYGIGNNGNLVSDEISEDYLQELAIQRGGKWGKFGWDEGFDRYDWIHRTDHDTPFERTHKYLDERRDSERPFFLLLHTNVVHDYFSDAEYYLSPSDSSTGEGDFPEAFRSFPDGPRGWKQLLSEVPEPQCVSLIRQKYENGIRELDRRLDRLFECIDLEETLVVLASDHGEGFSPERNRIHHCGRLHDDLLKVPLAIWVPTRCNAAGEAGVDDRQCSVLDIAPTILSACGKPADGLPGRSLIGKKPIGHRQIHSSDRGYLFWNEPLLREDYDSLNIESVAETVYPLKIIRTRRQDECRTEIYNLANDPQELFNLAIEPAPSTRLKLSFVVVVNDWPEFQCNVGISSVYRSQRHEWILIDNSNNLAGTSISKLYREASARASGELIIFCHQDVYFPPDWEIQLEASITQLDEADPAWGVIGSVGIALKDAENPYSRRVVGHWCDPGGYRRIGELPARVQSLDEQWMGIRVSKMLSFDESLPGFHCYGVDICQSAMRKGLNCYAIDAFVWHKYRLSNGRMPMSPGDSEKITHRRSTEFIDDANRSYQYVAAKWREELPFFSTSMAWDDRTELVYQGPGARRVGQHAAATPSRRNTLGESE
ncbi:MAG: sulfatase-like hydrolase/transferase [Lysobacteraceae bacterium]